MTTPGPERISIASPNDLIVAAAWQLGFMPAESVMVICLHGERRRFGLVMRFDLDHPAGVDALAEEVGRRVRAEKADHVVIATFSGETAQGHHVPHELLVESLVEEIDAGILDAFFVSGDRWWSYTCKDACCYQPGGLLLHFDSLTATSVGAAHALAGHRLLPDRAAVERSVQCTLADLEQRQAVTRILRARDRHRQRALQSLRQEMRALASKLVAERLEDPRATVASRDVVALAALSFEATVRDEVLVLAIEPDARKALLAVLSEIVRRVPPMVDAPVCSMFAWIAYADGDGVLASLCVDRALRTNPNYSLAKLINDALCQQVPPRMLEEVMQRAAHDLRRVDTAG